MRLKSVFNSIAFRISMSIAIVIAASMTAVGWLILREEQNTLEMELQKKGSYLAKAISHQVSQFILKRDFDNVSSILKSYMIDENSLIVYAGIYDADGINILKAFRDEKFSQIKLPAEDAGALSQNGNIPMGRKSPKQRGSK